MSKPTSKLYRLREWLTIPEAAKFLTGVCDEEVSESDVLRLALDGHLTLSVDFPNKTRGKLGSIVSLEETKKAVFQKDILGGPPIPYTGRDSLPAQVAKQLDDGTAYIAIMDECVSDDQFLHFEDAVETISGVWDLPLIGSERLDIEHAFQQLTGGPEITLVCLNGTLVARPDGTYCSLRERFKELSIAERAEVNRMCEEKGLPAAFAKLEPRKRNPDDPAAWFPAAGLPADSVLVVRMSALSEFQRRLADEPLQPAANESKLFAIIAALAKKAGINIGKPWQAGSEVARLTQELGAPVSVGTIAKHFERIADEVLQEPRKGSTSKSK